LNAAAAAHDDNDDDDDLTMTTFSRFIDFIADSIALTTPAIDDVTCITYTLLITT